MASMHNLYVTITAKPPVNYHIAVIHIREAKCTVVKPVTRGIINVTKRISARQNTLETKRLRNHRLVEICALYSSRFKTDKFRN